MPRRRMNISSIYVLVKKKENGAFCFTNERRHHDGFVLITRGKGVLKLYNSVGKCEEFPISKGSLMLFRKYDKYSIELEENTTLFFRHNENVMVENAVDGVFVPQIPFSVSRWSSAASTWK